MTQAPVRTDLDTRRQLVATVEDFARKELAPRVTAYDQDEKIPRDLLERMAELGIFGGTVPVELGGLGLDHVALAEVVETISQVCHIMGTLVSMPSGLVGSSLARYGNPEQQERWLRPLAEGRLFGGAGVTEPRSGSDVAGMQTTYRKVGDGFLLNGAKAWISNLDIAGFFVSFATMDKALGRKGISAFIIPADTPGLGRHPYKDKLGFRPICTGDLVFDDLLLPPESLLGEEGEGFRVAMTAVEKGRLGVAARSVGVAQACLDASRSYANVREAFGQTISNFQIVQSKITDMAVGVHTGRLLTRDAAEALDRGERARQLTCMAKMYASDVAFRSAGDALQIHGAAGVSSDVAVGRYLRDSKVLQIVEGSNDLHRNLIAEMELGIRSRG